MTDKKSKRVVIINNIKSDTIDQAIFILKDNIKAKEKGVSFSDINASVEAQEIINSYINTVEKIYPARKKKSVGKISLAAGIVCTSILILLTFLIKF